MISRTILYSLAGLAVSVSATNATSAAFGESANYVYVETNLKPVNGIRAFARNESGQLHEIAGSPFKTGGAGTGYNGVAVGPEDSDQEIITNPDHSLLFAINAGSDSIAVFSIEADGALKLIPGSPFPSGGNDPVSLDINGDVLYIANKSGDPNRTTTILPNYTTMIIQRDGTLHPASDKTNDTSHAFDSTISVAAGSSLNQVHVVKDTNIVFGNDFLANLIEHFRTNWDGGLRQLPPLALPDSVFTDTTTPRIPQGIWTHPSRPYLYVGVPLQNKLAVYKFDREGNLAFLRAVPNEGQTICWLRTNERGNRLYSTETSSNSVGVYDTSDPEYPVQLQEFKLSGEGNAFQLNLSPDGRFLYVLSPRGGTTVPIGQGNVLHTVSIGEDGLLSETLPVIPFKSSTNARPRGIIAVPAR